MKKTLEYLYIFSKLSTSFILLLCILVFGYFFYASFKNQEKSNNDQVELINKLNNNSEKLTKLTKKVEITDTLVDQIKKVTQNFTNTNRFEEINLLNNKIEELNLKLENISVNLKEIQSLNKSKLKNIQADNNSSLILDKNKIEIAKLVISKFENNLDFTEELKILQNLNDQSKQHVFEKINLIKLKNFRGNTFMKNIFSQELDFFLKENFNNNTSNFISKSLMRFVAIEPSKKNTIKNNEINVLNEVSNHLDKKNYKTSHEKIININNYEKYFSETINQIKIFIEFKELIKKVS